MVQRSSLERRLPDCGAECKLSSQDEIVQSFLSCTRGVLGNKAFYLGV